jgi:hypothetical protein
LFDLPSGSPVSTIKKETMDAAAFIFKKRKKNSKGNIRFFIKIPL